MNNSSEDAAPGLDCDEVVVFHEFPKNDFLGEGTDNNIKMCADKRLCIPTWLNTLTLRKLNPRMFRDGNSDGSMLTMADGRLESRSPPSRKPL